MNKISARIRRGAKTKALIRKSNRARLVVNRSSLHIYASITVPHPNGDKMLVVCSSRDKELKANIAGKSKQDQARLVGQLIGKRAKEKGITQLAFDRSGYKYHGRVKALAEGVREAGLEDF